MNRKIKRGKINKGMKNNGFAWRLAAMPVLLAAVLAVAIYGLKEEKDSAVPVNAGDTERVSETIPVSGEVSFAPEEKEGAYDFPNAVKVKGLYVTGWTAADKSKTARGRG